MTNLSEHLGYAHSKVEREENTKKQFNLTESNLTESKIKNIKKNKKNNANEGFSKNSLSFFCNFLRSKKLLIIRLINTILICIFFSLFFNSSLFGWDESCYISNSLRILGKTTILENIRPMFISIVGTVFGSNILLYKLFSFALIPLLYLLISRLLEVSLLEKYRKYVYAYEAFLLFSFISFQPLYDLVGLFMVEIFSVFISFIFIFLLSKIELHLAFQKNKFLAFLSGITLALLSFSRYPFLIFFPITIGYLIFFAKKDRIKLSFYFAVGFLMVSLLFLIFLKYFLGISLVNSLIEAFFAVENEYAYIYQGNIFYYINALSFNSPIFFVFLIFAILNFLQVIISRFFKATFLKYKWQRTKFILSMFFVFNLLLYTLFTHKEPRFLMYMFFYLVAHFAISIGQLGQISFNKPCSGERRIIRKAGNVILVTLLLIAILSMVCTVLVSSKFIVGISQNIKSKEDISNFVIEGNEDLVFFVSDPRYSLLNPEKKVNGIYASAYFLHHQLNTFLYEPTKLTQNGYFDAPCAMFIIDNTAYPISADDTDTLKIFGDSIAILQEKSKSITKKSEHKTFYEICR